MKYIRLLHIPVLAWMLLWSSIINTSFAQEKNKNFQNTKSAFEMVIYPIPAKTELNVRMNPALLKASKEVVIVNIIGREIVHQEVNSDHQYNDVKFYNLQQLPNGIYMIIAKDEYGKIIHTSKVFIEN